MDAASDGEPAALQARIAELEEQVRELSGTNGLFGSVLDNLRDLAFAWNFKTQRTDYLSPSWQTALGHDPEELMAGGGAGTLVHPDDVERVTETTRRLVNLGRTGQTEPPFEVRMRHRDGHYRWFSVSRSVVLDEDGNVEAAVGAARDVTDRKKAEDDLRASEETARALLNAPPDLAVLLDAEGNILAANEHAARTVHTTVADLIGTPACSRFPPEAAERRRAGLVQVVTTGEAVRFEDELGGRRLDNSLHPVFGPDGQVQRVAVFSRDITELEHSREALQTADEVIAAIPVGVIVYEHQPPDRFVLLSGNPEAERLTKVDITGNVGRPLREAWPAALEEGFTADFLKALRTDRPVEREVVYREEDASINRAFRSRVFPLAGNRVAIAFEDITDRVVAEASLAESEARYRSLVENMPAVTYTAALDEASTTTYVSPQIEALVGLTPEQYASDADAWRRSLHPDDRDRVLQQVEECHRSGRPFASMYRLLAADGRTVWVWDQAAAITDDHGTPLFLQGMMFDTTARQEAEQQLRESEERFRLVFDESPIGMAMVGPDQTLRNANRALCSMLGYEPDELAGMTVTDITHPDDHEESAEMATEVIGGSLPTFRREKPYVTKDGRVVWCEITGTVINDSDGNPDHALVMILDISERKDAERRLLAYQTRLRSMAAQLAATEERERREIAAGLHDQVGQLLTLAVMHLHKLHGTEPSPERADALNETASLIDGALAATRTLTFELSPPVLHQMGLTAAIGWLADQTQERDGLKVMVRASGDDDVPQEVRTLLFRCVRELLHNVVKHAEATAVAVSVRARPAGLRIRVRDDGIGFALAEDALQPQQTEGFGLLSIRERLASVDGSLEINSQPGVGTAVTVRVPLPPPKTPQGACGMAGVRITDPAGRNVAYWHGKRHKR